MLLGQCILQIFFYCKEMLVSRTQSSFTAASAKNVLKQTVKDYVKIRLLRITLKTYFQGLHYEQTFRDCVKNRLTLSRIALKTNIPGFYLQTIFSFVLLLKLIL